MDSQQSNSMNLRKRQDSKNQRRFDASSAQLGKSLKVPGEAVGNNGCNTAIDKVSCRLHDRINDSIHVALPERRLKRLHRHSRSG